MAQNLNLKIAGLHLHNNQLSEVPEGALSVADNMVIDKLSVAETRRGFKPYGEQFTSTSGEIGQAEAFYQGTLHLHHGSHVSYDSDGTGTWITQSGTFNPPGGGARVRFLEANKNLFIATDTGIQKLDEVGGTWRSAGAVKALGGTYSLTGSSGFLTAERAVAYRLTWSYTDINDNEIVGSPSQRLVVINANLTSRDVISTWLVPDGIDTTWVWKLYRSGESADINLPNSVPDDEVKLVKIGSLSSAEASAKIFSITDSTPNSLRGEALYTNPSQQGILQSNDEPPLAKDIALYNDFTFFSNTTTKHRYFTNLLGADDTDGLGYLNRVGVMVSGNFNVTITGAGEDIRIGMRPVAAGIPDSSRVIQVGSPTISGVIVVISGATQATSSGTIMFQDVVGVAGNEYFASTSTNPTNHTFLVTGSETPAENLEATALSLIETINRNPDNEEVYAYHLSGDQDIPGKLLFEERGIGGDEFFVYTSNGGAFDPPLNNDPDDNVSTNEAKQNRLMFSKPGQPEAVPITNTLPVGSENFPIRRILALRDALYILKGGDGIWRLTGTSPENFNIAVSDASTKIRAPETAVVLNNQIFLYSDQGVIILSDTGSGGDIKSFPIESTLRTLSSSLFIGFETAAFAVAYEADRKYLLFTPTEEDDLVPTQCWCYNYLTDTWTRWPISFTAGISSPVDGKLYLANPDNLKVYQERKDFARTDYADEQFDVTLTTSSGVVVDMVSTSNIEEGFTLVQGVTESVIEEVISATRVQVSDSTVWTAGSAIVYEPITTSLKWVPNAVGNPGIVKQVREASFIFRDADFDSIDVGFASNFSPIEETVTLNSEDLGGAWGVFPWGTIPWGVPIRGNQVLRTYVPLEKQRNLWLNISVTSSQSFTSFSLAGISLILETMSERFAGPPRN